jgi:RNA polymerase sigma-70 factor (ECF subfamily)
VAPRQDDAGDDAELSRRVAGGQDPAAEAELCRRLYPRVRAYGLRHLRDGAGAADLAQTVLVVVIETLRAGKVDEVDRLAAFVMGVCRNTLYDWRKSERRRRLLLEEFGPSMAAVATFAPARVDRARLAACIERLPARERMVVALTYLADRDSDEIARAVGLTAGNVRVVRHRALRHLHECLGGVAP